MLWCHLQSVFYVLIVAVSVSGLRESPPGSPTRECGPSNVAGGTRQPCTTKRRLRPPPLRRFALLFEKNFGRRRVIDGPFHLMDGTEVNVGDGPVYDIKGTYFRRRMFTDRLEISSMKLKAPSRLNESQLDSRKWDLDHDSLDFKSYTTTMIEQMFAYGIAEMNENATAKVLSIGLGGGYINSYLHRNYRRMNITVVEVDEVMFNISKTWFGLNLDNRQRVIIGDGVEYVKRFASAREAFDVIHLDACTMDESAPIACPISTFLVSNVVESFSALLGPRGILVINVMTLNSDYDHATQLVKEAFEKSFKKCDAKFAPFAAENTVMTCAQFDPPSGLKEQYQQWKGYRTRV